MQKETVSPGPRGLERGPDAETYLLDLHQQLRDVRAERDQFQQGFDEVSRAHQATLARVQELEGFLPAQVLDVLDSNRRIQARVDELEAERDKYLRTCTGP